MAKKNPDSGKTPLPTDTKMVVGGIPAPASDAYQMEGYELIASIEVASSRSIAAERTEVKGEHIGQIIFDDGTEWIGYVGDLEEVFNADQQRRNRSSGAWVLPSSLAADDSRSGLGTILLRIFNVFKPKAANVAAEKLAERTDRKVMPSPGLYVMDRDFRKTRLAETRRLQGKVLLLLHGTLSSTEGSFGDLRGDAWSSIVQSYDHVLALDHYTLSVSPFQNALELLKAIPAGLTIDILSHSRGGLVGDVLSRCDSRNPFIGFSDEEIKVLAKEGESHEQLLVNLNRYAREKGLVVDKFVRVACPAKGTTLLSKRLDHFLNALLNTIGLAIGGRTNFIYSIVKEFLMDVVASRTDADAIPGLWAMVPESAYQSINNGRDHDVKSTLYVIAGDGKVGGSIGNTLLVIFSNLFYWNENDFVVDTKSMKQGISRAEGLYHYLSRDSNTTHFNYFKNENTRHGILLALQGITTDSRVSFERISKAEIDRGVNFALEMKVYHYDNVTGNKPIAIILPGIMGSTLKDKTDDLWLDLIRVMKGHFVTELNFDAPHVTPSGAMRTAYKKLGDFLLKDNDLRLFSFDWRLSMDAAAANFEQTLTTYLSHNQPINIIAHSMGGLVVKLMMITYPKTWKAFCASKKNNVFLLGTPWKGSHLIMEVLTGHSRRIKQLQLLDFHHGKADILHTVGRFPGVFELLPLTSEPFETSAFWADKKPYAPDLIAPPKASLNHYLTYKSKTASFAIGEHERQNVYYIAGQDDTVCAYEIKKGFFTGKRLVYLKTSRGDGSVTWELGIPKELPTGNIYYSQITHGQLANEEIIFETISDIIKFGSSNALPQQPPQSRSADILTVAEEPDVIADSDEEAVAYILGYNVPSKGVTMRSQQLAVSIFNADLKNARHPVLVGHFKDDGLYSAEGSLDRYLNKKLSERHRLGYYPGEIGESEITYHSASQPRGALVIGLGKLDDLTPYRLALSVEKAIIKYAFFFRDNYENPENKKYGSGISAVIIGSVFAGLSIGDSVKAIITGVQRANDRIIQLANGLEPIKELEFVDYYEDVAQLCYQVLKKIEATDDRLNIVVKKFNAGSGSKRRLSLNEGATWWHTFHTTAVKADERGATPIGLSYSSTSGRARVEHDVISADLKTVEYLSKAFSHNNEWDFKLSKTMFELLVPNDFKSIIRNQSNIIWKMDAYAAQFPWEMFHDYLDESNSTNETPTFVNTGLIRQLITDDYRINPVVVEKNKAIVIGDPDYSGSAFGQLPGAAAEANLVAQIVKNNGYEVLSSIHRKAADIIKDLYSDNYKIMHVAAHGVYEVLEVGGKQRFTAGIVLGDGAVLEPGTINQLSSIPEFIFVNCCYSGTMAAPDDKYYKYRANLAANIGTQLIHMGVKAVVVAGWAVNDAAAKTFSNELYNLLFEGYEFGIAAQRARKKCFDLHRHTNTWGAYQCYGDHYYKLTSNNPNNMADEPFVTSSQAKIELDNMLSHIKSEKVNVPRQLDLLARIKSRVNVNNLVDAEIEERYALIYAELGEYKQAVAIFKELLHIEQADFAVSSLELYCSLRGKLLVSEYREIKAAIESRETSQTKKNAFAKREKELATVFDKLFKDLEIVGLIGSTAQRLALMGSAYKRAALVDYTNKVAHLHHMMKYFGKSYEASQGLAFEETIYPLTSYLVAGKFLKDLGGGAANDPDVEEIENRFRKGHPKLSDLFAYAIGELNAGVDHYKNYYQRNAIAKIRTCQFLYETNPKKSESIFEELRKEMLDSLTHFANMKHILGEKEHLEFLVDMAAGDKQALLGSLKSEVAGMLNSTPD